MDLRWPTPTKRLSVVNEFMGTKSPAMMVMLWFTSETWKWFSTPATYGSAPAPETSIEPQTPAAIDIEPWTYSC